MWDLWWIKWPWDRFLPEYFGFSPVNFIPPLFHYTEKTGVGGNLIVFNTGLHRLPQGCGASIASAAGPFTKKKIPEKHMYATCSIFILLRVKRKSTIHTECIVAFPLPQWLCERNTR
jgi:hypothetical protein